MCSAILGICSLVPQAQLVLKPFLAGEKTAVVSPALHGEGKELELFWE